jgi:hypothetical protein
MSEQADNEFDGSSGSPSKTDETIAQLESKIQELDERLLEDRFCSFLVIMILLDVIFFFHMENWGGPIAILFLEVVLLIIMGRKMGVDDIRMVTDKLLDMNPLKK